ncbi:asparaginyl-tRNA synthetase [Indivirus ILV1]|uniref:asparagine--tRNA ligase n=1 Tax=Indivirus ILV1 TaxID=1977633 RepID=A0A1V0SDB6_9VIRU|nr:asparaginyl-tRNA synthetase [Indivirus ILV1]
MSQFEGYIQGYTDIKNLYTSPDKFIDTTVTVCGWIKTIRISGGKDKRLGFVKLSDGSCQQQLQIIFDGKAGISQEIFEFGGTGVSLCITGLIVKSPAKGQYIEMQANGYKIYGTIQDPDTYPISKTKLTLEHLRTIPHLRNRTDTFQSIMRIKSCMRLGFAEYFENIGFTEVQVPLITDNECESGANAISVTTMLGKEINTVSLKEDRKTIDYTQDFFKKHCYLTVSGQLHLETIVLGGLSKAWCMTTAFRGEPSQSRLHAAEFWMLELEFCFNTLYDNIKVNEGAIKYVLNKILTRCKPELEFLESTYSQGLIKTLEKYANVPFIVTTHEDCVKRMLDDIEAGKIKIDPDKSDDSVYIWKEKPSYDGDLSKDHERYISEVIYDHIPTFVRYYPKSIKSFYMPVVDNSAKILRVDNFDCIFPFHGEIIGGSQRIDDYNTLISRMEENGIKPESLEFYSDLRKYGTVPHGGSGIGIDRLLLVICGLNNIRDMIPFPRACELCYF